MTEVEKKLEEFILSIAPEKWKNNEYFEKQIIFRVEPCSSMISPDKFKIGVPNRVSGGFFQIQWQELYTRELQLHAQKIIQFNKQIEKENEYTEKQNHLKEAATKLGIL